MKLREQILSIEYKVQENEGPVWERGFRIARADAAHLAAKQDELIHELAQALEDSAQCLEDHAYEGRGVTDRMQYCIDRAAYLVKRAR